VTAILSHARTHTHTHLRYSAQRGAHLESERAELLVNVQRLALELEVKEESGRKTPAPAPEEAAPPAYSVAAPLPPLSGAPKLAPLAPLAPIGFGARNPVQIAPQ
jgi:hypothetical protein